MDSAKLAAKFAAVQANVRYTMADAFVRCERVERDADQRLERALRYLNQRMNRAEIGR